MRKRKDTPSEPSSPHVRAEHVIRIRRALSDEETAIENGQDDMLERARATLAAAKRNATNAEIEQARRLGPGS